MKLYTREQMIEAFNYGQNPKGFDWIGDMIDSLTPIELPSDKEMDKFLLDNSYEYGYGYRDAIDWIKKQILNQNK